MEKEILDKNSKWLSVKPPVKGKSLEKDRLNKKPSWLRVKLPSGKKFTNLRKIVDKHRLHTICESGNCPNMGECWGAGTATFMILGNVCTRSCTFCAVATGRPPEYDDEEYRKALEILKAAPIPMFAIGYWAMTNE